MKYFFVLVIIMSTSYTAFAKEINKVALEQAISKALQTHVEITKIRGTYSPLNWYLNILDNNEIRRINMIVNNQHHLTCDLIVYEDENKVRLEYCNSNTSKISDGYIYY